MWFCAAANHCALRPGAYPVAALKAELTKCHTSKGTIRFEPDKPLPDALVRKLVKARISEHAVADRKRAARR